ncbi:MAG: hypothetical protein ACRDJ2_13340 [Actinomycetota bacterium]
MSASIRVACVQLAARDVEESELAWHKEMAPRNDVVRGRRPEHYSELARADRGARDQSA